MRKAPFFWPLCSFLQKTATEAGIRRIILQNNNNGKENYIFYGIVSSIFRNNVRINKIVSDIKLKSALSEPLGLKVAVIPRDEINPAVAWRDF